MFIGVPRVFDRIYTGVLGKVQEAGGIKKFLFDWGYKRKSYFLKQGFPHDKVREQVLCSVALSPALGCYWYAFRRGPLEGKGSSGGYRSYVGHTGPTLQAGLSLLDLGAAPLMHWQPRTSHSKAQGHFHGLGPQCSSSALASVRAHTGPCKPGCPAPADTPL